MSLATSAKISRYQWTLVPITDATIARVEALAKQERQPLIQESGLVVKWQYDMAIDDDVYDRDYDSDDEPANELLDPPPAIKPLMPTSLLISSLTPPPGHR